MSVRFAALFTIAGIAYASAESGSSTWSVRPPLLPAAASEVTTRSTPIKIEQYHQYYDLPTFEGLRYALKLRVTSIVNSVDINSVIINRGNCKADRTENGSVYTWIWEAYPEVIGGGLGRLKKTPEQLSSEGWENTKYDGFNTYRKPGVTLNYGDTKEFGTSCGEILEVVIKTNLGDFKFGN